MRRAAHIVFDYTYDGLVRRWVRRPQVDGKQVATNTMPHSIPFILTIDETFDVGADSRTPIDTDYQVPFRFTGKVGKVTVDLKDLQLASKDQQLQEAKLARAHD